MGPYQIGTFSTGIALVRLNLASALALCCLTTGWRKKIFDQRSRMAECAQDSERKIANRLRWDY